MASRQNVNIKFVTMLTTVIVIAVAGVLGTVYFFLHNSAADLARMGDKRMAAGQYKEAASAYSKAVNKQKTNSDFLRKWIEALKKTTPEEGPAYKEAYEQLRVAMYQFATIIDDPAAQREYLEFRKTFFEAQPFNRDAWEWLAKDADTIISRYTTKTKDSESFRRYRGLANCQIYAAISDLPTEMVTSIKTDLEAAIAANPADQESAYYLSLWYAQQAQRAKVAGNAQEEQELSQRSDQVRQDFLAQNPKNPLITALSLKRARDRVMTEALSRPEKPSVAQLTAISNTFAAAHLPEFEALAAETISQLDRVPQLLLPVFRELELTIDNQSRLARTESLLKAISAKRPTDTDILFQLGMLIETKGEHRAEAVEVLQKIVDLPMPSLSTAGLLLPYRKVQAMFGQSQALFHDWQFQREEAERTKILARFKDLHERMVPVTDANNPGLTLTEAELSLMTGDLPKTDRLLAQLDKNTANTSADALMLEAEVAIRRNKPGAAKEALETLLTKVQPNNLIAAIQLAGVEQSMGNNARARMLLDSVREVQPDNQYIKDRISNLDGIMNGGKVSDPILQVIYDINQLNKTLSDAKDPEVNAKVAARLRSEMTRLSSQDPRLVQALAVAEVRNNNMAGAKAALEAGIAANPESKQLRAMLRSFTEPDEMKRRIAMAEDREQDPTSIAIEKYVVYHDFQKPDEARVQLAEAIRLSPNDPRVLELEFMQAIEDKNFARAEAITERAGKEDLDGSGGDTYRARLESAKGNTAEAVRIMTESVGRGGAQPETWRLLGRLQNTLGRQIDAIASFRSALKLRPNDVASIKDLLSTQIAMRQGEEALATARAGVQYADGDPNFVHMWLNLEASIGNRDLAVERRAKLFALTPEDQDNAMALAAIYMDSGKLELARPIIDGLKAKFPNNLAVINLDAGWHWAGGDRPGAKKVFEDAIAAQDQSKLTSQPYMAYADFLAQRQDIESALVVLETARPRQDPKNVEIDRAISDANFNLGRLDASIAASRRIVEAGADTPKQLYRKRLAESYINQKKYKEADEQIAVLRALPDVDSVTFMLDASSREGQGDAKGQREILDRAVAKFPTDAMVFVKRGQAIAIGADDPSLANETAARAAVLRDSIEDFTKALQLTPNMYQALRMRAAAYQRPEINKSEEAIADLRTALSTAPNDDNLFVGLLQYLLANNRDQDAVELSESVMEKRPRDTSGLLTVGQVFANADRWDQAIRMVQRAYEIDGQDAIAQRYLDTLLTAVPPRTSQAELLLNSAGLKPRVAKSPGFLMAQARVHMQLNRSGQALRSAADSLALLDPADSRIMLSWFNEMKRLIPDKPSLTNFIAQLGSSTAASEWLNCFRATLLIDDTATRAGAIDLLRGILANSKNTQLRQFAYRILGASLYNFDRIDEAVPVMQDAIKEFPNDYETMNNLAYSLAKRQNKPQELLPLAEKSVAGRPQNADAIDTLGYCYLLVGRPADALATFNTATNISASPQTAISLTMHMAETHLALGNKDQAKLVIANAAKMAEATKDTPAQTKTEIEDLRKKIMAQ